MRPPHEMGDRPWLFESQVKATIKSDGLHGVLAQWFTAGG
jgi:hypothetical protein